MSIAFRRLPAAVDGASVEILRLMRTCLGAFRGSTGRHVMVALAVGLLFQTESANAQPTKAYLVGFLSQGMPGNPRGPITKALEGFGYFEGQNIIIERRYAEGDAERFPSLAAELVALKPDVIVAETTPGALAAKRATASIPIVMYNVTQPVATGLIASLAHPGGNVTGLADLGNEMVVKGLDLLHAAIPKATRIAVLMSDNPAHQFQLKEIQATAKALGLTVLPTAVKSPTDFEAAFASMAMRNADAVINLGGPPFGTARQAEKLGELTTKDRLPMLCPDTRCAEMGGLMSYSPVFSPKVVATYIDSILKGADPRDLPSQQPTRFELVINLKTAKAMGIAIPRPLVTRANRLIE